MSDREVLGQLVRETWVNYCNETGDTKPSHIAPWNDLSEWDKEVDRRIGEAVRDRVLSSQAPTLSDLVGNAVTTLVITPETAVMLPVIVLRRLWACHQRHQAALAEAFAAGEAQGRMEVGV